MLKINKNLRKKSSLFLLFAMVSSAPAWAQSDQARNVDTTKASLSATKPIFDTDAVIESNQEYAQRCDTCTGSVSFIQAAVAAHPRSAFSVSYVVNLQDGVVKAVYLDWDPESRQQLGGYEVGVDPILAQYVANTGQVYRDNGYSLNLNLVVRADGSVYWVKANGSTEELSDAVPRLASAPITSGANSSGSSGMPLVNRPVVNDAPPNSSPIDLRGYQFSEPAFSANYPSFPATSYDMAYNSAANVSNFARDQLSHVTYGAAAGVMDGTVTANAGATVASVVGVGGGTAVTANLTSTVSAYIPMRDGGFALVQVDLKTGVVTIMELQDGQANMLPTNHPTPANSLPGMTLNFTQWAPNGQNAFNSFQDWLYRSGIPVNTMPHWWDLGCTGQTFDGLTVTCLQPQ